MIVRIIFLLLIAVPAYAQQTTRTFAPIADTFVNADLPTQNFGTGVRLDVDGSPVELAYLAFDLAALDDKAIVSAMLRLWVVNPSNSTQVVKHVDAVWSETLVTYATRPPSTTEVARLIGGISGVWRDIDVTTAVQAKAGLVMSLSVENIGADGFFFASREAANAPQLVVVYESGTPPPPVPDTTPPTVVITAPAAGALVAGLVQVTISANDSGGISRAELSVDGVLRGSATTAPFTIAWDTTNGGTHACTGAHTHILNARAYDVAGNSGTSQEVSVNMANPAYCTAPPPTTGAIPCAFDAALNAWRCPPIIVEGALRVTGSASFEGPTVGIKYDAP